MKNYLNYQSSEYELICKTYFHPYLIRCGTYYLQTSGVEVTYS